MMESGDEIQPPAPIPIEIDSQDVSYDAEAPVKGQGRMDAAWGSSQGDEVNTAQVAPSKDTTGFIFEQVYQPWNGTLNPRWMRNWAILRHHVAGIFRKGHRPWSIPTRLFLVVVFIASLADVGLTLLSALIGSADLHSVWGVNRDNLYGHVLGFFPRNVLYFPIVAALLVGGVISEDRLHGTSALYFSRPINRFDYVMMKYLSVALIQAMIVLLTLFLYYFAEIISMGRGWAWIIDTFPLFLAAVVGGTLLIITYTSIGLGLSSVSKGKFFPGIGLIAIVLGTKTLAIIVSQLFDREILYLLSPYDCLAHVGQAIIGTEPTYDQYSWTWSLASLVAMNALSIYVLSTRVSSMEVTRE
ncbi:MAG: ABC transporter permease subunit [Candidatus Poseidoniaceae archaeon]|jgi:ABC-type transport system involved in multi-copper enzyme maturation permease subunit|nr:ABC transporter permease subunit [Candidatus Poseidoniaceae archaeon]